MNNIPIVTAATAVDGPKTGVITILVFGQAIYMGDKVKSTLLCPNQMRTFGVTLDDTPMHLAPQPKPSSHSIHSQDEDFSIPLSLKGVFSYFESRTPTLDELSTCRRVQLTDEFSWDPHSETFQEQEINVIEHNRGDYHITASQRQLMNVRTSELSYINSLQWSECLGNIFHDDQETI
jgi:hypothetical protein